MKVFGVVYLIWNKVNGKRYVGQTVQTLKKRFNSHATCKKNMLISKAIQKYGRENFYCGIIKTCMSKEELDYWEKFFIVALKSKSPYGYNMTDGGEGTVGYTPTQEIRDRISAAQRGEKNHNFGKHHTKETLAKLSLANSGENNPNYGKHHTAATLAKISAKLKGRYSGENNPFFGKHFTTETCMKLSATQRTKSPFKNLLNEMDAYQLTYSALAKLLGLASSSVSLKMHRKRKFTENDKAKLVEIFGKPIEYLLQHNEN